MTQETIFSETERRRGQFHATLANLGSASNSAIITGPIMLLYATGVLGLDSRELGAMLAFTSLAVFVPFLLSPIVSKVGKARLMVVSFVGRIVVMLPLFFLGPDTFANRNTLLTVFGGILLLYAMFLNGVTSGVWQPLMRDITTLEDRGRFFARMRMFFSGMAMLFYAVSVFVIGKSITRPTYLAMLGVLVAFNILSAISVLGIPSRENPSHAAGRTLRACWNVLRTSPLFRWPLMIQAIPVLFSFPLIVLYLTGILHVPDNLATAFNFLQMLSVTLSFLYWGRVTDMVGYKAAMRGIALLYVTAIPLILFLAPLRDPFPGLLEATNGEWATLLLLALLAVLWGALGAGLGICTISVQHHMATDRDVLVALPLFTMIVQAAMAVSMAVSGSLLAFAREHPIDLVPALHLDWVKIFLLAGTLVTTGIWFWARRLPDVRQMDTSDFYAAIFTNPLRPFLAGMQMYDPAEERRSSAVRSVAGSRNPFSVRVLSGMLDDPSYDVTVEAIRSLGQSRSPQAARALLPRAADDEYQYVREHVFWALGELGSADAVPIMLCSLENEQIGHRVRSAALRALGKIGDHSAVPSILAFIRRMEQSRTIPLEIASACYALLRLEATDGVYEVCRLLPRLEKSHSRYEIVYLLARMIGIQGEWILRADSHEPLHTMLLAALKESGPREADSPTAILRRIIGEKDHDGMKALLGDMVTRTHANAADGLFRAFREEPHWSILDNMVGGWIFETQRAEERT